MTYSRLFAPPDIHRIDSGPDVSPLPAADKRGDIYFFTDKLILAVNVAMVTGRPLLLAGPPGSGKSTLARHIAHQLNWRYYAETVTTQTRAQDLLYHLDLLKRLYDANAARGDDQDRPVDNWSRYVSPGVLWWAFNPDRASSFVNLKVAGEKRDTRPVVRRTEAHIGRDGGNSNANPAPAVVLLDEIDKADPDVPNNLLQALGRLEFDVLELEEEAKVDVEASRAPLIIITTNEERSLPDAFIRRCVVFRLQTPGREGLLALARSYFGENGAFSEPQQLLCDKLVDEFERLRSKAPNRKPSTAEFLDAVEVCFHWKLTAESPELAQVLFATVEKNLEPELDREGEA